MKNDHLCKLSRYGRLGAFLGCTRLSHFDSWSRLLPPTSLKMGGWMKGCLDVICMAADIDINEPYSMETL